jgi:catechol 2,3-dioxygenase-like lactoylglutathione lyase family enzyme
MHLNHLDLPMPDVAAARDFFVTHLGYMHVATRGQDALAILRDATGGVLVLSPLRPGGPQGFPEGFHIGFHLESRDAVDAMHARLSKADVELGHPPRSMRGGWMFYFKGPGDLLIEVAHFAPVEPSSPA